MAEKSDASRPSDVEFSRPDRPGMRLRFSRVGPGLVLAAASVGAADMVTSINGAAQFGMGLLWAAALGVLIKFVLTEGVGRHYLATGRTFLADIGERSRVGAGLLLVVFLVIGLLYGAGLSSVAALALTTLIPTLPLVPVAATASVAAAAIVLLGRYDTFESIMKYFMILKFGLMVTLAAIALASIDDWAGFAGSLVPQLPAGSLVDVVALIGGVGGTAGVIAYGYWVREKGWRDPSWLPVIRFDSGLSYVMIFVFVVATTIVGTVLVYGTGASVRGTEGLSALSEPMGLQLGAVARVVFLLTFTVVAFSALVGGFNGLAHMLSDSARTVRGRRGVSVSDVEGSGVFRLFVLGMLVSSLVMVFAGRPVTLLLAYAAVGSLIMPIVAAFLLFRMNRRDIDGPLRNGAVTNLIQGVALALFALLAVVEIMEIVG
ncbi:Mn2+/Fe2+ NRAMP family transporter [Prauserella sediminis]|uniref:Mn2+/Fe2+ NRAMP family transporter n=1 Tax=Prauserella sediminis TaxID=577680 RepID=A0A839XMN5_9PSEU|nr:Nramp family divalent metal transporter [Prauserella sediminis]MBB3664530.1 Mn2+/Fe2+ NRAMP family transporter [Prauserella sediminis]